MEWFLRLPPLVWLVFSALMFAAGEYASKIFAGRPGWGLAALTVALYAVATVLWLPAILKTNQLAVTGAAWSVLSLATTVGLGIWVFGESVTPLQMAGLALAFGAVVLLSV